MGRPNPAAAQCTRTYRSVLRYLTIPAICLCVPHPHEDLVPGGAAGASPSSRVRLGPPSEPSSRQCQKACIKIASNLRAVDLLNRDLPLPSSAMALPLPLGLT